MMYTLWEEEEETNLTNKVTSSQDAESADVTSLVSSSQDGESGEGGLKSFDSDDEDSHTHRKKSVCSTKLAFQVQLYKSFL